MDSKSRSGQQGRHPPRIGLATVALALTAATAAGAGPATRHAAPASQPAQRARTTTSPDDDAPADPDLPVGPTGHGAGAKPADDLTGMSLEDLMNVRVTSVSKQPERIGDAPAAITVITQDDIQRSGLQSLPELLRLVPGMDVARLNASTWAIGTRGFSDVYQSNKLLVLSDGRSLYSPMFSGVFWDLEQPMLQNVDRVEVIRGPGATLWGSNAVNGVINIITKSARDTQGGLITATGGNYDQSSGFRYGGQLDDRTYYRVYAQGEHTDAFPTSDRQPGNDAWQQFTTGFRFDRYSTPADTMTLQGDFGQTHENQTVSVPTLTAPYTLATPTSGDAHTGNLLGRWTHVVSPTADFSVQTYYDHIDNIPAGNSYRIDTGDVQVQGRFALGDRQEIVTGGECRFWNDEHLSEGIRRITVVPASQSNYLLSAFVQDDLTLVRDRLHLIAGTKVEQTSYSGFDVQPSGRLLWTPDERNMFWTSVSHAVRTPSRYEQDVRVAGVAQQPPGSPLPVLTTIFGQPGFKSESLTAYELGYRFKPAKTFSIDTSLAYNDYQDLQSVVAGTPSVVAAPTPYILAPFTFANGTSAQSYDAEVAANWAVTDRWRLAASYSLEVTNARGAGRYNAGEADSINQLEHGVPRDQAQLHSYVDLTRHLQWNTSLYYTENLAGGRASAGVPSYIRVDTGLTWHPDAHLTLSAGVQNLFQGRHAEYSSSERTLVVGTDVPRTVYGQVTYSF